MCILLGRRIPDGQASRIEVVSGSEPRLVDAAAAAVKS
jgi:hypothetical protein